MKQELFLQAYQTPEKEHLENWLLAAQTALWLLYEASDEVAEVSKKWQKYSEPKVLKGEKRTASQTKKGAERLFLSFAAEAFMPQKCEKGVGRRKGEKQVKRAEYKVAKKVKAIKAGRRKAEKME